MIMMMMMMMIDQKSRARLRSARPGVSLARRSAVCEWWAFLNHLHGEENRWSFVLNGECRNAKNVLSD